MAKNSFLLLLTLTFFQIKSSTNGFLLSFRFHGKQFKFGKINETSNYLTKSLQSYLYNHTKNSNTKKKGCLIERNDNNNGDDDDDDDDDDMRILV